MMKRREVKNYCNGSGAVLAEDVMFCDDLMGFFFQNINAIK